MIGICTDSNAQLPTELADRYGVEVVPLTVCVDDREYLEGVDLDVDDFYDLHSAAHPPRIQFGEPSPGQFALAYDDLIARGCTQVVSIHSARTLKAARLAAHNVPVQIRLVDARTSRFGVSCCVWAAGERIAAGAPLEQVANVAETLAPQVRTVFTPAGLDLLAGSADPVRIATLVRGHAAQVGEARTVSEAVGAITAHALKPDDGSSGSVNVAVGWAHGALEPMAAHLESAISRCPRVRSVVRFRIGPSVGIDTGPGTVGCVLFPAAG